MKRVSRIDFVRISPSGGWWRALFLLVALLALGWASARWVIQRDAIQQLSAELRRTQPAPIVKPVRSAAQQRELDSHAKAVSEAVRQLNLPIIALLKEIQPPKDIRIALLGLDVSGKTNGEGQGGPLKITAEARTPQEMTTYVAFLADKPMFESVYLVKHELNAASAEKPYRFLLEAQWRN